MPTVSVVIPTYNRANCLSRAIDSVLNQTLTDFEAIVVDDGSTDDTSEVVAKYSDERLQYIRLEENSGANAARNVGIEHAEGEYISFLDSDDELLPSHLETCLSELQSVSDRYAAVCTSYKHIEDTEIVDETVIPNGELSKDQIYKNDIGGFSCYTVRSSIFDDIALLDESLPAAQDMSFCIDLNEQYNILAIEDCLVRYSIRNKNRIEFNTEARIQAGELILEKYGEQFSSSQRAIRHFRQGILHAEDNLTEARSHFLNAIRSNPRNPWFYYHYTASLLGQRGFTIALNLKPIMGSLYDRLETVLNDLYSQT